MFAVIFEVQPRKERWDEYLDLAKQLKPKLEAVDGFIDNERFISKSSGGHLLSLSTWRDEKSVVRWRTQGEHRGVQEKGRVGLFEDYHLRTGEIIHDNAPPNGITVEETRFDATDIGAGKICTLTEVSPSSRSTSGPHPDRLVARLGLDPQAEGLLCHDLFDSIYHPGKLLILGSWRDRAAASFWRPTRFAGAGDVRHRLVRIIRDYGMFDRREAPQFFPAIEPSTA